MADEQEFEDDLELEDTTERETDDAADHDDEGTDRAPANRWQSRRSMSEILEDAGDDTDDDDEDDAPQRAAKAPRSPADAREDEDDDEDDEERERKAATADAAKDGEQTRPRFRAVNEKGEAVPFELPKGTKLAFQGDGKEIAVEKMEDLVQLAQKGAGFDTVVTKLETRYAQERGAREAENQSAEQTLLAVLFGTTVLEPDPDNPGKKIERQLNPREVRERLRPALKKYLDPDFRAGQEALNAQRQTTAEQERAKTEQLEQTRNEFWQGVGSKIAEELADLPALTREDAPEITTRFYAGYTRAFEQKFAELRAKGTPEADATQEAQQHAFTALSDANLRRVMRGLHAELEPERRERTAARDVKRHNDTTQRKLRSRNNASKLRGGGASPGIPPVGSERGAPREPKTFQERTGRIGKMFDRLRSGEALD